MDEEGQTNREANLKEAVRFWRAWKTVHQMCKDRVCDNQVTPIQGFCATSRYCDCDQRWVAPVAMDGEPLRQSRRDANERRASRDTSSPMRKSTPRSTSSKTSTRTTMAVLSEPAAPARPVPIATAEDANKAPAHPAAARAFSSPPAPARR